MSLKIKLFFYSIGLCFWAQISVADSLKIDSLDLVGLMELQQTIDGSELEKEMDQSFNSSLTRKFNLGNSPNAIITIKEDTAADSKLWVKQQFLVNFYLHANQIFCSKFSFNIGVNNALNEVSVFP